MSNRIARAWARIFARKPAGIWEQRAAVGLLRRLSENPFACEMLAAELDIQADGGDSAADFVSFSAENIANKIYRDALLRRAKTIEVSQ